MNERTRPVIIAGNHRQAVDWCRENGINPREATIVTSDMDAYRLQGRRFTAEDVHRVGTWYDNRMVEVAKVVNYIVNREAQS